MDGTDENRYHTRERPHVTWQSLVGVSLMIILITMMTSFATSKCAPVQYIHCDEKFIVSRTLEDYNMVYIREGNVLILAARRPKYRVHILGSKELAVIIEFVEKCVTCSVDSACPYSEGEYINLKLSNGVSLRIPSFAPCTTRGSCY